MAAAAERSDEARGLPLGEAGEPRGATWSREEFLIKQAKVKEARSPLLSAFRCATPSAGVPALFR